MKKKNSGLNSNVSLVQAAIVLGFLGTMLFLVLNLGSLLWMKWAFDWTRPMDKVSLEPKEAAAVIARNSTEVKRYVKADGSALEGVSIDLEYDESGGSHYVAFSKHSASGKVSEGMCFMIDDNMVVGKIGSFSPGKVAPVISPRTCQ